MKERVGEGGTLGVCKPSGTKWMGEREQRRQRMDGAERKGRRGHPRGLTARERGLTCGLRLQVFHTSLAKTKIKPRNVNLFSIVSAERREIKIAYIHIK